MSQRLRWRAALRRCRQTVGALLAEPVSAATRFIRRVSQATHQHLSFSVPLIALLSPLNADDVLIRTKLSPETVWVGQRMQLQIDVLGKDGWAQISDLSELEVPGSYIFPSGNSRVRLNETIDGTNYTGQRYELSIYPQRSGKQELPSIALSLKLQKWGLHNATETIEAATSQTPFTAKLPPGTDPRLPLVVSTELEATQTWEPDKSDFTVGDALKRSIVIQAANLPAMVLPPLLQTPAETIKYYPASPELSESDHSATRKESGTYLFEQSTTATLPDRTIQWWNPESNELQLVTLQGRALSIVGGPQPSPAKSTPTKTIGFVALACVAMFFAYARFQWSRHHQGPRNLTESEKFKNLAAATKRGDSIETLNLLMRWLSGIEASPSDFFNRYADEATQATAHQLLTQADGNNDLQSFRQGLKSARKRFLRSREGKLIKATYALPPMNQ